MKIYFILGVMLLLSLSLVSADSYWDLNRECNIQNGLGTQERSWVYTPAYCEEGHSLMYYPYCDWGHYHPANWDLSEWSECSVTSCNEGYEQDGNACVLIEEEPETPTPTPVQVVEPAVQRNDPSCVVTWKGCENGVAVKNAYDPLPNSNLTKEEKTAKGYNMNIDPDKYCWANPKDKPDCSVVVVNTEIDSQEPVKEQVITEQIERTFLDKLSSWFAGKGWK
jgi:hypothetical protein